MIILTNRLEIRSHHIIPKSTRRNNGAIVLFRPAEKAYVEFQIETVGERERRPEGGGRRQGGIPRDSEIRFWANCLASSSSDSFGSRFPGVKPNRLLKRDDARIVPSLFPDLLFPPLIVHSATVRSRWLKWDPFATPSYWNNAPRLDLWRPGSNKSRIIRLDEHFEKLSASLRSPLPPTRLLGIYRHLIHLTLAGQFIRYAKYLHLSWGIYPYTITDWNFFLCLWGESFI